MYLTIRIKKSVESSFRKGLKRSGILHCRFHDLRHTFATTLVMKGVHLATIQELLGHKSPAMTKRYSHPTPEHKRRAVEYINLKIMDTSLGTSKEKFHKYSILLDA